MTDWVRVSDPQTGVHRTADRRELARNKSLRELKSPAVDGNGMPLPPKFKSPLGGAGDRPAEKADEATSTEATKEATA